ncbi:MAG: twin-arginine translocase TatA/TatE family subunit [Candidatus Promineifilaceae bacterium]|jgi:Tat protein translocase TatB subunit
MDSFFGIGMPELVLILVIAGIVMGPERIGVAARWLGKTSAQLQSISRSFVNQLNAELDGIKDADEIRGALNDMQDLRNQVEQLKQELISVSNTAVRDSKGTSKETQEELKRTIAPPTLLKNVEEPPVQPIEPLAEEDLPKRLDVPDDPE